MAKLVELLDQIPDIVNQIFEKSRQADLFRALEYNAAVTIQSWFRGVRVRAYLKHLNKKATLIQKIWRGHFGRKIYRHVLSERVKSMKLQFYNDKATIIQKRWRGFYSRKYIFNYYKRKAYLLAIQQKNESVLNELKEYKEYMERQREEKLYVEKYNKLEQEAKRNHYLLSTKQVPGVYNSPYKQSPAEMEYLMKNVKLEPSKKHDLYVAAMNSKANKFEAITLPTGLPPLPVKPQGPFREPLDVRRQRYRPFSPSLRVETDFETVEKGREKVKAKEWVERLHDEIFYPIDKTIYKKPYNPLMLTRDKYSINQYGTKYYREPSQPNELMGERFKSLVPPIPEFNKLNKTYVEAHYYMQ